MKAIIPAVAAALLLGSPLSASALELTVMSFNIWGGGANAKKPVDETVAAIKAVNPDIIGIQETKPEPDPCTAEHCVPTGKSVAAEIAKAIPATIRPYSTAVAPFSDCVQRRKTTDITLVIPTRLSSPKSSIAPFRIG